MVTEHDGHERREEDRRGESGLVLQAVSVTQHMIAQHNMEEIERMRLIDGRIDDLQTRLTSIVTLIDKYMETHNHVLNAFPAGDIIGHKESHEAWLSEVKKRAEFWDKMKLELSKWGLLLFVGWAGMSLWNSFIHGPK